MRVDSRTVCRPSNCRPCVVVLVCRPPWSCVIRRGRASSTMVTRHPSWLCVTHCPLSLSVHGRPSFIAHCSAVVVRYPSSSVVHHRWSSIHPPSSLVIRHCVIGCLWSNAHRLSPVNNEAASFGIRWLFVIASSVACRPTQPTSSCIIHHRRSCIVSRHWSVDRRLALSTVNKITMNDRMRVKCRGILIRQWHGYS